MELVNLRLYILNKLEFDGTSSMLFYTDIKLHLQNYITLLELLGLTESIISHFITEIEVADTFKVGPDKIKHPMFGEVYIHYYNANKHCAYVVVTTSDSTGSHLRVNVTNSTTYSHPRYLELSNGIRSIGQQLIMSDINLKVLDYIEEFRKDAETYLALNLSEEDMESIVETEFVPRYWEVLMM